MKGWRKEMRPKGFLLSVKPSSSKETAKIIYRVHIGMYVLEVCIGLIIREGEEGISSKRILKGHF